MGRGKRIKKRIGEEDKDTPDPQPRSLQPPGAAILELRAGEYVGRM